jgi:squalene cyclase
MPFQYSSLDISVQYNHALEPAMADAYSMVVADALGVRPNIVLAARARMIAARQSKDGDWNSFHGRPPSSYSSFTMTALAVRAISLYHHPSQAADTKARVTRARQWLLSHTPRDTEERTFLLLGLHWSGADRGHLERAAQALKGTQQPDGGWNSLDGRASEAYSTGQVLVALHDTSQLSILDGVWNRGIDFLLKTQAEDGSWHVTSRLNTLPVSPPYFDSGYPYGHDQFISVHGL